ncbi:hypothetical protein GGS23DRAFT_555900 [Durotheca rogersii]|uniref:uncharacterized protein n=1 Tax=Durotheca rogersii TaxID=419775 RepID=UPI0022204342|nr:uncharacterized protein GGS23DRAFT_555900 [Durotheca rogersii]KAI5866184.1 hypothetical protein GGS23DRAFT_555900 [Durotheca rogersii]
MTAAAYARDLVNKILPNKVEAERKPNEFLSDAYEILENIECIERNRYLSELTRWITQ